MTDRRRVGPVERAVRRDIRDLSPLPTGARSLGQILLILAQAVDDDEVASTTKARCAQELRVTLTQLREVVRDGFNPADGDGAGTAPDWDTPQP